ncbi:DUF6089 family protein [Pseudochryseolinea flava]|uniref:DUF6089 domain-containing protein n=1 Tax=Pseudochryseolinea flava TaxID=2059302 RepID=A0A364YBA5_9BACT|nr:DUF6089 family protein [Pseudochryseolinea flava]RAW03088.1 hypothetical protein DQQ10_03045 [Pseudochryseolinea flava]
MKVRYVLLVLAMIFLAEEAIAQMNRRAIKRNNKRISSYRGRKSTFSKDKVYSMVGLSLNALNYYGDLAPKPSRFSTDISFTKPAVGLSFGHRFGPRYTLTASFMYGALKGSDASSADRGDEDNGIHRSNRNVSFRNRIKELSVIASIDLFENQATYISRVSWTPYAFAGLSVFHHNPQAQVPVADIFGVPFDNAGEWVDLQPLGTEGQNADLVDGDVNKGISPYKRIQFGIPFGIGARFRLNHVIDVSGEIGFRYTFTDYLDDVSGNYVDLGVFGDDRLAQAMSYRGYEIADASVLTDSYVGRDGKTYTVIMGHGRESKHNMRGSKSDKDIFMVTTIRVTYILGKTFHRAKFR